MLGGAYWVYWLYKVMVVGMVLHIFQAHKWLIKFGKCKVLYIEGYRFNKNNFSSKMKEYIEFQKIIALICPIKQEKGLESIL